MNDTYFYFKLLIAVFLSFVLVMFLYPIFIKAMKRINYHQEVSEYSLEEYKQKAMIPTMGGLVFVGVSFILSLFLNFEYLNNYKYLTVIFAFLGYGMIGFLDDYIIVIKKDNLGLKARYRLIAEIGIGVIVALVFSNTLVTIPGTTIVFDLKFIYPLFVVFLIVGTSNAVNITDGMDGLAGGLAVISLFSLALIAYFQNSYEYFFFSIILISCVIGYLFFNFFPARVIMGDVGSLALGSAIALLAIALKQELLLMLVAGVFMVEVLCVIIQIGSVKLFKKKVFPYTPIHYTFRLIGYKEKSIVFGFWLIGIFGSVLGVILAI